MCKNEALQLDSQKKNEAYFSLLKFLTGFIFANCYSVQNFCYALTYPHLSTEKLIKIMAHSQIKLQEKALHHIFTQPFPSVRLQKSNYLEFRKKCMLRVSLVFHTKVP